MRGSIIAAYALLSAGAAQAQRVTEPYATIGEWQINAEDRKCGMMRSYPAGDAGPEEVLIVFYDAQRKVIALNWGTSKPKFPPLSDSYDLNLAFLKGSSFNETWGSQTFQVRKSSKGYVFSHVFTGSTDSDRLLRDLGSQKAIALFFGPTLMTSLPLGASEAITKLRECSSKVVERDGSVGPS